MYPKMFHTKGKLDSYSAFFFKNGETNKVFRISVNCPGKMLCKGWMICIKAVWLTLDLTPYPMWKQYMISNNNLYVKGVWMLSFLCACNIALILLLTLNNYWVGDYTIAREGRGKKEGGRETEEKGVVETEWICPQWNDFIWSQPWDIFPKESCSLPSSPPPPQLCLFSNILCNSISLTVYCTLTWWNEMMHAIALHHYNQNYDIQYCNGISRNLKSKWSSQNIQEYVFFFLFSFFFLICKEVLQ